MNRRVFIGSVGAVVTAALVPETPMSFCDVPLVWDSYQGHKANLTIIDEASNAMWVDSATRTFRMLGEGKPDLIVVSETFKKLFDECVSGE